MCLQGVEERVAKFIIQYVKCMKLVKPGSKEDLVGMCSGASGTISKTILFKTNKYGIIFDTNSLHACILLKTNAETLNLGSSIRNQNWFQSTPMS